MHSEVADHTDEKKKMSKKWQNDFRNTVYSQSEHNTQMPQNSIGST